MQPKGNRPVVQNYQFSDQKAEAGYKYQYRIKQVNKTDDIFYSNIAFASVDVKEFSAAINPNPASSAANLDIQNPSPPRAPSGFA